MHSQPYLLGRGLLCIVNRTCWEGGFCAQSTKPAGEGASVHSQPYLLGTGASAYSQPYMMGSGASVHSQPYLLGRGLLCIFNHACWGGGFCA